MGLVSESVDCVEFVLKKDYQTIASAAWIQFNPSEYSELIANTFKEMVDLWNEKYFCSEVE
jgi:hypothetical protein